MNKMVAFDNTNILKLIFKTPLPHHLRTLKTKLNNKFLHSITLDLLTDEHIVNSLFKTIHATFTIEDLYFIELLPNDTLATISDRSRIIKIWELNTYMCIRTIDLSLSEERVSKICLLLNNNLAVGYGNGIINILDTKDNCIATNNKIHYNSISCLLLLGNGKLASGASTNPNQRFYSVVIWDIEDKDIRILNGHCGPMIHLINLSEKYFVSVSDDCTMKIWDIKDNYTCVWKYKGIGFYYGADTTRMLGYFSESYCRVRNDSLDIFETWEKCLDLLEKIHGKGKYHSEALYLSTNHVVIPGKVVEIFEIKTLKSVRKILQNEDYPIHNLQVLKDYRIIAMDGDKIFIWTY
jgi:WD40 repeat protein